MRGRVLPLLVVAALAAGCGAADPPGPDDATPTPGTSPSIVSPSPDEPSPSPSPTGDPSPSPLAGEPFDGPPLNGQPAELAVLGVAADDMLNVRSGPGVDAEVIATLAPLTDGVPATGRARLLPGSIWLEVEVDGGVGWVNSSFLAFLGPTDDVTAQVVAEVGALPNAETMVDLADQVASVRASTDPASLVVISDGPSVGDLGEVTVDVVGLGDDAVRGERLVVFATPDASGEGFTVMAIEATTFCARGAASDGRCP